MIKDSIKDQEKRSTKVDPLAPDSSRWLYKIIDLTHYKLKANMKINLEKMKSKPLIIPEINKITIIIAIAVLIIIIIFILFSSRT